MAGTFLSPGLKRAFERVPGLSRRNALLGVLLLVMSGAVLYFTEFDWRVVPGILQEVSQPMALLLMATLPIVGFPISAVYLGAGLIFGPYLGCAVILGVTTLHLLVTHGLATTVLRSTVERWRNKWSARLPRVPPEENVTLVAMIVIMPGLPYIARNCLIAFSTAPLRVVLGVGLPLYVLRSLTSLFIGDFTGDPSRQALLVLVGIYLLKLAITVLLFWRLKKRCHRAA